MTHIKILICFLMIVCIERSTSFSYHETVNITKKSSNELYDYILGPEFFENERFAYIKVKYLNSTPSAIEVKLEVYNKSLSIADTSTKKFVADIGSTEINVTSWKFGRTAILSISEMQNTKSQTMLFEWDPFGYPDPSLYLPMDHIIVSCGWDFQVFVDDNTFCPVISNGKCWIQLEDRQRPNRREFFYGDLVWSSMHIDYTKYGYSKLFIRGFDTAGNYKFLDCGGTKYRAAGCSQLHVLPNANSAIKAYSLDRGLCYIENPGKDLTVSCLKFDRDDVVVNKTITYEEPMSLLDVKDCIDESEIVIIAKKIDCEDNDCLNIVLSKIPHDPYFRITHRYLALECANNEKLFKVSVTKRQYINAVTVEYICENDVEFTFKSATINDD